MSQHVPSPLCFLDFIEYCSSAKEQYMFSLLKTPVVTFSADCNCNNFVWLTVLLLSIHSMHYKSLELHKAECGMTWRMFRIRSVASRWAWQLVCESPGVCIPAACSSPAHSWYADRGQYCSLILLPLHLLSWNCIQTCTANTIQYNTMICNAHKWQMTGTTTTVIVPSVLWCYWLGNRKCIRPV